MLKSAATVQNSEILPHKYVATTTSTSDLKKDLGEKEIPVRILSDTNFVVTEKTQFKVILPSQWISAFSNNSPETIERDVDWIFESPTPFDQFLSVENNERRFLIQNVKNPEISHANRIFDRLVFLESATEDEYPYTELISVDSLNGFLNFLKEFKNLNLKYPDITITPDGNIHSQWQEGKECYLSIEFVSPQEVKVVVFTPDSMVMGKITRIAAKMSILSIFENLSPYNILTWISE